MKERKEVKRVGQKRLGTLKHIGYDAIIAILIMIPLNLLLIFAKPAKIIETLGITDFISVNGEQVRVNVEHMPDISELKGEYVCDYYLLRIRIVISDEKLEKVSSRLSTLGTIIVCLNLSIMLFTLLLSKLLPKDCHYIILWHGEEDYFYVSLPEVSELKRPLQINRNFSMGVIKKTIKINDGITEIALGYDKEAEELLKKLQKQ